MCGVSMQMPQSQCNGAGGGECCSSRSMHRHASCGSAANTTRAGARKSAQPGEASEGFEGVYVRVRVRVLGCVGK